MNTIMNTVVSYAGTGFLVFLYAVSLIILFLREDNRINRSLLFYMPVFFFILYVCPLVYLVYGRLDNTDTYYRLLWLLPATITIAYTAVKQFSSRMLTGVLAVVVLITMAGSYTYKNENILRAENRLHLPQMVLDVTDYILGQTNGNATIVAMPPGLVQFVRQYDARIWLPYGREVLMPQFTDFDQPQIYVEMTRELTDPQGLAEAVKEYGCNFLVIEAAKVVDLDLNKYGLEFLENVDGYNIYRNPDMVQYMEEEGSIFF